MQFRSHDFKIKFLPIQLDPVFPMGGGGIYVQSDRPITQLHAHDCLEIGYCYSGSGIFIVGEKVLPYEAGDVVFINHTEVHLASSAPGTQSHWSWIYLDPVRMLSHLGEDRADPTLLAGSDFNNVLSGKLHPDLSAIVLKMLGELEGAMPGRESLLRALTVEFLIRVRRIAPPCLTRSEPRDYARLAPALQRLSHHYSSPLKVSELARCCGLSEPHFRRMFTRTLGRSPRTYWNNLRIEMASSLLRSTRQSVLEISAVVGFETLSSFNRLFLARFGCSPRARRMMGEGT